jgi:hypothetical protein
MSTTNTVWRSAKSDPPKPEDFPVMAWENGHQRILWSAEDLPFFRKRAEMEAITHWLSVKADPPPREMTQRERGEEAFWRWYHDPSTERTMVHCWHAALAWEREAVEEDLVRYLSKKYPLCTATIAGEIRDFFRARREGGSK